MKPTCAELSDGSKKWYLNGLLHRTDGPAIERGNGLKVWYLNGVRHREDGPAIEYSDGTKEWFLDGLCYTFEEHKNKTANNPKYFKVFKEKFRLLSGK